MAKPIAVIYFPENMELGGGDKHWIYEYMAYLNGQQRSNSSIAYREEEKDYYKDYYWFCFYKPDIDEIQLQVFYEKDWTEIQQSEMKALIEKSLKEINHGK